MNQSFKVNEMECFGKYSPKAAECVGGTTEDGEVFASCDYREACTSCTNAKAVNQIRPETTLVRRDQPAGARSPHAAGYAPPSEPQKRAPAPTSPAQAPVQAPNRAARVVERMPEGVQVTPVQYQAVTQDVLGKLPVNEPRRHAKRKRLVAEVTRAGLVGMAQQFAAFVANTPFLPEDGSEDDDD